MNPRLIKSLSKPPAYPEATRSVSMRQTHVSFLFLTDHFVYKVKKPVNFGFLNFSTLDRRRFYCMEEVRLNSRLSPELYLGVVELRETPEGAAFHGTGAIVDYAVKMRRLPEERMLVRLLQQNQVAPLQMRELARTIADFHAGAASGPEIALYGSAAAIRGNWEENFRQTAPFLGITLRQSELSTIRSFVESFIKDNGELLQRRIHEGFIRECDGDIHSANICLAERVFIFDCIEFNERFRYCDTAADIAFLLMDLEYEARPELCAPFLGAYRELTGDRVPGVLLNFYQAYRAFVRGKVESLELNDPEIPPKQKEQAALRARRYFRLCRGFSLREKLPPALMLTCGLMGSGKSTLAQELSFELGVVLLRADLVRKELFPTAPPSPGGFDQGIYSPSCNQATYETLLVRARDLLSQGKGVVVDASFRRESDREAFRALAHRLEVPFFLFHLTCDESTIRQRLLAREQEPEPVSDGRWELFAPQKTEFEPLEPGQGIPVDGGTPVDEMVERALKGMGLVP